jgi:hypothetical protein
MKVFPIKDDLGECWIWHTVAMLGGACPIPRSANRSSLAGKAEAIYL